MDKNYHSIYGLHIKQFIQLKRKLGFKYITEAFTLSKIDALALETDQSSVGITKEFTDIWAEKRPNESEGYRYHRILVLVKLSSYMNDLGVVSFIPRLPRFPKGSFVPYIYSQKEIAALFKACDMLRIGKTHKNSCLFCMPVLLRLLYATGIRIGEALELTDDDVNLEDTYIRIKDAKNGKQRIIPISPSLVRYTRKPPPPRLPANGYVTLSAISVAIIASKTLPPCFIISEPMREASSLAETTIAS